MPLKRLLTKQLLPGWLLLSAAFCLRAETLVFGIVPQQSATRLAQVWTPILEHLGKLSGMTLLFSTARDIPTFEERVRHGQYDVAYMNPYHYTVFSEQPGYQALAHRTDQPIKGIIVVPRDSEFNSLTDLAGTEMAFPAPAAFAASVIPRATLQSYGITVKPVYVSSHDSVYLNVSRGLFKAGGGVQRTLNTMAPEVRDNLRVLWSSPGFTPHAIATRPGLPENARQRLLKALVGLSDDETGRALLRSIRVNKGFGPASHEAWDDVRQLNIDLLEP